MTLTTENYQVTDISQQLNEHYTHKILYFDDSPLIKIQSLIDNMKQSW